MRPFTPLLWQKIRFSIARSWAVCWPMTLIMFFEFLIALTDVYIAGRIGKDVQAAYGLVMQLYFILIVIGNALTVGTVSVVSRLFTSENKAEYSSAVFSSFVSAAAGGIVLASVGFFFAPGIINILRVPEQLKQFGSPLVKIYALGLFFHYALINSNGVLRSCNRIKDSLRTMALVCLVNISLNFLIVFHTPLAFRGIALSTALSVCLGALLNLFHVSREMAAGKIFSFRAVKRMARIGWPMGVLQILWQLSSMVLFIILSALPEHQVEILAALTTGLRIESAVFLPAVAFNMANAVIVGNLLGERRLEEAYRSGLITAILGVGLVSVLVIAVILNARWIASFLSDNPIVVRESVKYLYISMISEPFMAWGSILGGGLNGAGDTRNVMLRVGISLWLVRIPLSYMFVILLGFGATSVWWSMNISQFTTALLISQRYFQKGWR